MTPKPTKERAEHFRQAALMVRGMIAFRPDVTAREIMAFLEDQARANAILSAEDEGATK